MGQVITIAQQKGGAGKTTLAVNLAVALLRAGKSVGLVDIDPQGSAGRWFMTRAESMDEPDMEFATASAWGASYEVRRMAERNDVVIVDTPPKADGDLRPALRVADLVLVPVATSLVDLWAVESVLYMAERERKPAMIVLTRARPRTRLDAEVAARAAELEAGVIAATMANRVVYAETLGQGKSALDAPKGPAHTEMAALRDEVDAVLHRL